MLNPKNYKKFYDDIAEEAEVHRDLVKDFVYFFYDKVRKNLSDFYRTKFTTKQMINNYTSEWDKLLCI